MVDEVDDNLYLDITHINRIGMNTGKTIIITDEVRDRVRHALSLGISYEHVRFEVINPDTGRAINEETFRHIFKDELTQARYVKTKAVVGVLYEKALEGDITAISKFLNLQGRGIFNKKFKYVKGMTPAEQVDIILEAAADGVIGAQETQHYVSAVKDRALIDLEKVLDDVKAIKAKVGL